MDARRLEPNPILTPAIDDRIGSNVNGPSMIRPPEWVDNPLGRYYLYFADHRGNSIRLAYADRLTGPWRLQTPDPLTLEDAGPGFDDHVASPDVHVDVDRERVRLYFHGCCAPYEDAVAASTQFTRIAHSSDGLSFTAREEPLGQFYFRVFEYDGYHYALAKENRGVDQRKSGQRVYRSADGCTAFEPGPFLFGDGARHTALRRREETLDVFYSRIGDTPERILHATVDLSRSWTDWDATAPEPVIEPVHPWEGANQPVAPSRPGAVTDPVRQLRDPAVFREGDTSFLLYTVAGERGIAIAELLE